MRNIDVPRNVKWDSKPHNSQCTYNLRNLSCNTLYAIEEHHFTIHTAFYRTAIKNTNEPFGMRRANWRLDSRLIEGGSKWCLLFETEVAHYTHNLTLNRHR